MVELNTIDQMTDRRRRRRTMPRPPPASPLDDDDLLREILVRVPPLPSSIPRASLVCKRWRRLVSDPWFLRCLRAHHRTAPLLGCFDQRFYGNDGIVFNPILKTPDRIPPQRLTVNCAGRGILLLGCRHGRVAFIAISTKGYTVFVCDPITGACVRIAVPRQFTFPSNGTVVCAAREQGHVHGACHASPFKVVLVSLTILGRPMACVYSSETGMWGSIIRHDHLFSIGEFTGSSTLVGHAFYSLVTCGSEDEDDDGDYVLEPDEIVGFDLDRQSLTVMKGPPINRVHRPQIIKAMDGGIGLVALSYTTLQIWHRTVNCHNAATWALFKTVDLHNFLGLQERPRWPRKTEDILRYDEDGDVIFMFVDSTLFMVQLESMQFKRLYQRTEGMYFSMCHPFRSFYTAGTTIAAGCDRDEMLHDL